MMELTRKGEYAIRGMIYLARQPKGKMSLVGEIAQAAEVPKTFLAKILRDFVRVGLAASSRGTGGGFALSRTPDRITLREVVEAVEGPVLPNRCLLGAGTCERDETCRVHPVWKKVRDQIVNVLEGVTIAELVREDGGDALK